MGCSLFVFVCYLSSLVTCLFAWLFSCLVAGRVFFWGQSWPIWVQDSSRVQFHYAESGLAMLQSSGCPATPTHPHPPPPPPTLLLNIQVIIQKAY